MTDHAREPTGAIAPLNVRVAARSEELAGLRRAIRSYVESAGGDETTTDDLELVVSELATNVLDHTTSPNIPIVIERTSEGWVIGAADVADQFVLADVATLPATSERTGRGLFVVRSLVDELEIFETPTSRAVRCHRASTG